MIEIIQSILEDQVKSWRYLVLTIKLMWRGMEWDDATDQAYKLVYWKNPPTSKDRAK